MTKNISKNRISWIDAGKCIGILMVMFGHNWLHPKYCFYFYAFHMPLFFILAGYTFSAKQNFGKFLIKKAKALLIPYVTFALTCTVFYLLLNFIHTGGLHLSGMAEKYLLRGTETFLWFLPTLFLAEILSYLLAKCRLYVSLPKIISTLCCMLIVAYILANGFNIDYNIAGCILLVPQATSFIIAGLIYKKFIDGHTIENNWLFIAIIIATSIALAIFNYAMHNFTTMFSTGNFVIFVITALLASYGLILLLKKVTFPHWFLYIGISSILFYGLHLLKYAS